MLVKYILTLSAKRFCKTFREKTSHVTSGCKHSAKEETESDIRLVEQI